MKRSPLLLIIGLIVAFSTAAPRAAADKEHRIMQADIRMLQEQTQQLQLALGALSETLKIVTAKLDEQSALSRKGFADQKLLVDGVTDGIRVLREKLDDSNVRLASMAQEVEALRMTIPPPAPPASTGSTLGRCGRRLTRRGACSGRDAAAARSSRADASGASRHHAAASVRRGLG